MVLGVKIDNFSKQQQLFFNVDAECFIEVWTRFLNTTLIEILFQKSVVQRPSYLTSIQGRLCTVEIC
jgi:hypothetical protein